MSARISRRDLAAIVLLVLLWLFFFWRLFTPVVADQASLRKGDFSGQFLAFGAYQYQRMSQGQIPLWNPWNNGGMPFLADPQTAVFYPPRLLTIAAGTLTGGWSYFLLELEMAVHVLAFSLLMYLLLRRMTGHLNGSVPGAAVAAIISGYGGWTTGYPLLQLAILESAIWLPLVVLGIYEATRQKVVNWRWLMLSGLALGVSWLAGHSQTSWQLSMLAVAWLGWRAWEQRSGRRLFAYMLLVVVMLAFGLAAVQLLPGIEYLQHTGRAGLGYDAKGNGFPVRDLLQFLFPAQLSLFSPLYVGIAGLLLVLIAIQQRLMAARFWLLTALFALALSLGSNAALFPLLYNVLPGLRWFRGQERAAFLVSQSLAIVAGLCLARLNTVPGGFALWSIIRRMLTLIAGVSMLVMILAPLGWPGPDTPDMLGAALFTALLVVGCWFILRGLVQGNSIPGWSWLLPALLVFDLFTINMDATGTWESVPADAQVAGAPPALVAAVQGDRDLPFRVDGLRGLHDNYGSMYQVADMRGISPLFLSGPWALIGWEAINPLAWELFAVRYVYSDWNQLPIPAGAILEGRDRYGPINLHRLEDPRPWAHLLTQFEVVDSDEAAWQRLADPTFNERLVAVLDRSPALLPQDPGDGEASVTSFTPEYIAIRVNAAGDSLLSLAHPHYPGWQVRIDGVESDLLRAYGALSAVPVPAGDHLVELEYNPVTWRTGAMISALTLLASLVFFWRLRQARA